MKSILQNNKQIKKLMTSKLIIFLLSYMATYTLSILGAIDGLNVMSLFILITIYYLYSNTIFKKQNKADIKYSLILGFIFTLLFVLGWHVSRHLYIKGVVIMRLILSPRTLLYVLSLFPFFSSVILYLFNKLGKIKLESWKISNKKLFLISFISMFLIWFIYYGVFFPGFLSPDSIVQLNQVIGVVDFFDHHPVLHTLYIAFFYKIGLHFFGKPNLAIGFLCFSQIIILASILSSVIIYLKNKKVPKNVLILFIIYYSLSPIFGYYSITVWKDVIFGALTPLVVISLYDIVTKGDDASTKDYIALFIFTLLWVLFRNNGIYVVLLMTLMALIFFRKKSFKLISIFIIVFVCYSIIKGPIFKAFNIKKTKSSEYIAIPMQQVGRMIWMDADLDTKDLETINKLIPLDEVRKVYTPNVSDAIKFSRKYNDKFFDNNKKEFLNIYLRFIKHHPLIAIDGYLASTIGYWYPNQIYWSYADSITENNLGFKTTPFIKSDKLHRKIKKASNSYRPIISFYLRVAIYFWIILFFLFLIVRNKGIKYIYPFMPIIGIWLTLMAASPVFGEFRYIFGAVTSLPLVIGLALGKEKEKI